MGQNFNAVNSGGGNEVMDDLLENTNTLRSSFSGTSFPTSPVAGQTAHRTDEGKWYLYGDIDGGGAGWFEIVLAHHLSDVDMNQYELKNFRLENLGADKSPASGNVGTPYLLTTNGRMKFIASATLLHTIVGGSNADGIPVDLPASSWADDATNPPTAASVGTTPTIRGKLFDATNEKMSIRARVPEGYSADADLVLRCEVLLNAAETTNDTIDAALDYVAMTPDNNETATKTSTQATVSHDIGANTAQYSLHEIDFTIDYDHADNPVAAGDTIYMEFSLSAVSSVAGIIFLGARLLAPFGDSTMETI